MKIIEHMQFESVERRILETAWRWLSVGRELGFGPEEHTTINRIKDGNSLTRPQIVDGIIVWKRVRDSMAASQAQHQRDTTCPDDVKTPAGVILGVRARQMAQEMVDNLGTGINEVDAVLKMLRIAAAAIKTPPADEDENSDAYLEREVDQVVVLR